MQVKIGNLFDLCTGMASGNRFRAEMARPSAAQDTAGNPRPCSCFHSTRFGAGLGRHRQWGLPPWGPRCDGGSAIQGDTRVFSV